MRISDWSSDVCSSDLFLADRAGRAALKLVGGEGADGLGEVRGVDARLRRGRRGDGGEKKGGGEAILHGQFPVVGVATAFGMDARVGSLEEFQRRLTPIGAFERTKRAPGGAGGRKGCG